VEFWKNQLLDFPRFKATAPMITLKIFKNSEFGAVSVRKINQIMNTNIPSSIRLIRVRVNHLSFASSRFI